MQYSLNMGGIESIYIKLPAPRPCSRHVGWNEDGDEVPTTV